MTARSEEGGVGCITQLNNFEGAFLNELTLFIAWGNYTDRYRQAARAFEVRTNE